MKVPNRTGIFWIGYIIFFLVIGWAMASCNEGYSSQCIDTEENDMVNATSYIQLIELDLSQKNVDKRYTVRGKQIFYDVGMNPALVGFVSIKINSTQSVPISLSPGGEINFYGGLREIFISNEPQLGKKVRLLVSVDATINNPPNNPLTSGFDRTIDFFKFTNFYSNTDFVALGVLNITPIQPAENTNGAVIHYLDMSVSCNDYRDFVGIQLRDVGPTQINYLTTLRSQQHEQMKNIYLRPGIGLFLVGGSTNLGVPSVTFVGTLSLTLSGVVEFL